jgi:phage terminase large subunit-like protein
MHSALIVAYPRADRHRSEQDRAWSAFEDQFHKQVERAEGVTRLSRNVWLIDLTISPSPLGCIVAAAQEYEFPYGILPFDEAPKWLPANFDPKANQGQRP